jgi:Xaa-Pro aminopeptidase
MKQKNLEKTVKIRKEALMKKNTTPRPMPPQDEFLRRLKNVRKQMEKRGFDALVIYSSQGSLRFGQRGHVMYMSNYEPYFGDTMMVLPQDEKSGALLNTTSGYQPLDCTWVEEIELSANFVDNVKEYLRRIGLKKPKIGIVGEYSMSPALYACFQKEEAFSRVEPASDIIENERIVKSDWELQCIREASRIAKKGIEAAARFAQPGILDLEITAEIERVCRLAGSEFFPHYTMVISGSDSKYLAWWWKCGQRRLQQGDIFLLDFGTMYAGYCCDISRPFIVGQLSQIQKDAFEVLKQAQEAGRKAACEGALTSDVAKAVRRVYMQTWPERKSWGGGHGVGLEVHEWPFIGYHNITHDNAYRDTRLRANTVISLEPQIFIPNLGDFSVEDEFVVTKTGAERLNNIPQEIIMCR